MSNLTQFGGGAPTSSIINYYSSGGVSSGTTMLSGKDNAAKEVLSGALTADTLATLLTVTGQGELAYLGAYTKDTTSRTVRLVVTVDGVEVFDATSAAITSASYGIVACGQSAGTTTPQQGGALIHFNSSVVVQVASSLSETDKVAIGYVLFKR